MKTSSFLLACATAGVALFSVPTMLAAAATPAVEKCDVTMLIETLQPLLDDDNLQLCQDDSGFDFFPASGLPDEEQVADLCTSQACQRAFVQIAAADLPSCELDYEGLVFNVKDTANVLTAMCQAPLRQ